MKQLTDRNELFPVFLKASELNFLIVGGGNVAFEKLTFLLKSSPKVKVEIVTEEVDERVLTLAGKFRIPVYLKSYTPADLLGRQIIIAATNNDVVNAHMVIDAKRANVLINVADCPSQCDFYLGSIVTKGALKMAISTNGKSPTIAKRLRQYFELVLPDELGELINYLEAYRDTLNEEFSQKVKTLNELTEGLVKSTKTALPVNIKEHV